MECRLSGRTVWKWIAKANFPPSFLSSLVIEVVMSIKCVWIVVLDTWRRKKSIRSIGLLFQRGGHFYGRPVEFFELIESIGVLVCREAMTICVSKWMIATINMTWVHFRLPWRSFSFCFNLLTVIWSLTFDSSIGHATTAFTIPPVHPARKTCSYQNFCFSCSELLLEDFQIIKAHIPPNGDCDIYVMSCM